MTLSEFLPIMAYLSAAIGKPLSKESSEVYFDLLGDLPVDILKTSVKRVALEHKWASFPSVAELREAAALTQRQVVTDISPAEAWQRAWAVARLIDLDIPGSAERHLAKLPPLVLAAVQAFGLPALCYGKEPVGVVRGQFLKIYEQLLAGAQREALLPKSVRKSIAGHKPAALPVTQNLIANVGRME